jgi:hypothetical protein
MLICHIRDGKELWRPNSAADASGELYAMEQFNAYKIVENRSVLEHAHEL